ncbi:sigma 54-interacting transcriptional regulator [Metallumcola ferriviriculae]|uniref:Sigma 54-interacting transcriptional regulator n=2 Tax=Metallumcola ferriviriculae TaxID=3039180 RepID=A0AAU0ULM7_9FIRM|nr:sigma 54-interacting transcriptional regulator [Desulfitibacteraceae bacterium MK1]
MEKDGVDVIISRGVTGRKIKKALSLPVVLIEITSFDILQALYSAKSMGQRIAFLGHRTQDFCDFENIIKILGADVVRYPYGDTFEMEEQASKLLRSDVDVLVSTGLCIYEMAKRSGINAVLVQSGYDAIYGSIYRALELVNGIRRNQEQYKKFGSVLELSNDGILIVDKHNEISFMNPAAENLLDMNAAKIVGKSLDEIRESTVLESLITNVKGEEVFKEVGKRKFLVNSMLLNTGDDLLILFQSADRIQVMEQNIRRQLFKKGLYAKHSFNNIIGNSDALKEAIEGTKKFATANATVLIMGESGTGKELFAQSIHNESDRRKAPFVAINCAALPESLLESELFGYEEGAFTGAKKGGKIGLFEMAHGGTIFLDEIGEMTLPVQARLLRVLQEREIMRLGSDRVIPVDVRIIAATNYELYQAVAEGNFRNDLYHRLEVLNLDIPPLRNRKEDINSLANYFVDLYSFEEKKKVPLLTKGALETLKKYDWPGNIRELQNIIHKYVLLWEEQQPCEELITKLINEKIRKTYKVKSMDEDTITLKIGKVEDMEKQVIDYLLATGASVKDISEKIGTSRTTLWRKTKAGN